MRLKFRGNTWRLSYAITKYYPWRWFTPFIAIFSLIVLVILTLINVAANGYETIELLSTDMDYVKTHPLWWSALSGSQQTCDPRQLMTGDTFQTTNGAFQYAVGETEGMLISPSGTEVEPSDGWFYSGESLASLCSVYTVTSPELSAATLPSFNLTIDRSQSSINAEALYNCRSSSVNELALMELKMTYRTSLLDGLSYTAMPSSSIADFLPLVLDWLAIDMLVSVVNATPMVSLHVDATVYCPTDQPGHLTEQEYNECTDNPTMLNITNSRALYDNGSIVNIANSLTPALSQSVSNFLRAISTASQADMGIWQNNSFFVNLDMVNATILPVDAVSAAVSANPDLKAYYDQYDLFVIPGAQNIRTQSFSSSMSFLPDVEGVSLIATPYVCHMQKLKSPFSLVVSIIVADASEFTALWGVMMLIATYFAQRYDRKNYNAINQDDQLQGTDEEMSLGILSHDVHIEDIGLNTLSDDRSPGPQSNNKT